MKADLNTAPNPYLKNSKAKLAGPIDPLKKEQLSQIPTKDIPSTPDYKVDLGPKVGIPTPDVKVPSLPSIPLPEPVKTELKTEAVKKAVMLEVKPGTVKKNAIIFIKGLDLLSSPSKSERGYAGVGRIADSVEGSKIFGWNEKDDIIKEVLKVHPDYKVVLVGHSLGGDTAVEVAAELDSLEHQFRPVDLLVTMDAVGFNNDIISQNVKKHLNVFGENDFFFNDGPHVARRNEKTEVNNILSPLDHIDIDDNKEVQFEVVSLIQKTIA